MWVFLSSFKWYFHWSLNDSSSPCVSRTPLSILSDLSAAEVWMVLLFPLISVSPSLFSKRKSSNGNWCHRRPRVLPLLQLAGNIQIFVNFFIIFLFFGPPERQNSRDNKLFLLVNELKVKSYGLEWVIHLYFKIPENCTGLIIKRLDSVLCIYHLL